MKNFRFISVFSLILLFCSGLLHAAIVGEEASPANTTDTQGGSTTTTTPITTSSIASEVDPVTTNPFKERTLVLFKPEVIHRALIGIILADIERKGFKVVAMKFVVASKELIEAHYEDHSNKSFYPALVKRTSNQPIVALVLEGLSVVSEFRRFMGSTDPKKSPLGTLRATYGMQSERNLLHASDSVENARAEISLWFSPDQIFDYDRAVDEYIYYN
ncbi:signal peptide containing protein having a NDK (nucleoside-diphosphate kinase) domain [Cryptosporidium ryanae]|uniref:signal peptide containing protein having a NDK (nucleoside-diphosphate kinase) domain n=1 Tax=Cryptosporidium ryanae TaxID=515981 RepID=UPI00351A9353|nr:signal peptide containing protein having a NDK (nucleoside-diphosphate kinase) domain [Cryptosporidium ryanae]